MTPGAKSLPVISFSCTRCGACCNSAPQLSLPELFYHQERFIGCLSLRRVDLLQPRAPLPEATQLSEEDRRDFDAWMPQFLHRAHGVQGNVFISLSTQAYDEPGRDRCPALCDKLCALEHDHKPLGCRAVPLDPILPDSFQQYLLRRRSSEALYMGAHCITLDEGNNGTPLVCGPRVTDPDAERILRERRVALTLDKQFWGDAVFEMLRPELFAQPERVSELPNQGYYSLSLAPVLSALCVVSPRVRTRVVEFLTVQIELLASALHGSPQKPPAVERTLLGFFRANLALRGALQRSKNDEHETPDARRIEAWLGLPS